MKNIHIIQTDKPSRLCLRDFDNKLCLHRPEVTYHGTNQNIYITSDEEIKDVRPHKGKWQLETGQILNKFPNYLTDLSECKLVIMTTDQDLIKDGVQAIDDDFLEWFIKNPSCEKVEIDSWSDDLDGIWLKKYKIIIPKEESENLKNFKKLVSDEISPALKNIIKEKQETLEDIELEEVIGSRHCQFSVVENKLAIIYRNQLKILQAIKMLNNER